MIEDGITTNVIFEEIYYTNNSVSEMITTTKNTSRLIFKKLK
jgi:hypothetical protein